MIRLTLLYLFTFGLVFYAWRDWYKALCGLILMTAVNEHPDMPKQLFGIPGLNPWNLVLACVVTSWLASRRRERLRFDVPPLVGLLLVAYVLVILVAFARMFVDREGMEFMTTQEIVVDLLFNSIKWAIPGWLLFDGARTKERMRLGLLAALGIYLGLAIQVIRWMPSASWTMTGRELEHLALRLIGNEIGFSRVNMSMMLAGGSWAMLAFAPLARNRTQRLLVYLAFLTVAYGQALTGGRMGYVTWGVLGLILGTLRWRKYLLLVPVMLMAIVWVVPAARDRMLQGIIDPQEEGEVAVDEERMTSGRTYIWPFVLEKIDERPIFGWGMMGMRRTGLTMEHIAEQFPHPHNAYLEILLDSGYVGLVPVALFYLVITGYALRLFVKPRTAMESAVGGVASSLILALLVAAMGSQHFYPQVGSVGMWAAIGLMLRASVRRTRIQRRMEREAARRAEREDLPATAAGWLRSKTPPPLPA